VIDFDAALSKDQAENLTKEMCAKILSNPVIQKYSYNLEEVNS
ncbi:MAG TPA: phosphoribosylformylglycinamidine synthase, partial [Candidatus Marinimicrobia bacterium]|nr:phosphoribosylformylglycinamidine synthase [Candidatus Neomarinimicrobiota bacterium]